MTIEGLAKLNARLNAIPKAARDAVQPALLKAGEALADDMRQLAQSSRQTGNLIESIAVTPGGKSTPPYSQPGGSVVVPELQVLVTAGDSDARYAHLVEFGTRPHTNQGQFPGTPHPGAAPQPFFWPAFRLNRKRLARAIKRAIGKGIRSS